MCAVFACDVCGNVCVYEGQRLTLDVSCIDLHLIYLIYLIEGAESLTGAGVSESVRMIDQPALGILLTLFVQGSKNVLLCQPSDVELGDLKPSFYAGVRSSLPINHLLNPCIWRI